MVSSSSIWVRPLILGMYVPMPAPLSRSQSVYHNCCIPEGEQARDSSPNEPQVPHQRRDDRGADHEYADEGRQNGFDDVVDDRREADYDADEDQPEYGKYVPADPRQALESLRAERHVARPDVDHHRYEEE